MVNDSKMAEEAWNREYGNIPMWDDALFIYLDIIEAKDGRPVESPSERDCKRNAVTFRTLYEERPA